MLLDLLKDKASVHLLRQVWQQYYDLSDGKAKWRAGPQESADEGIIRSPYDPEARTGKKRETIVVGLQSASDRNVCTGERLRIRRHKAMPQLITEVQTTVANVQDVEMTQVIQEDLAQHDLLPDEQLVDTGYVDAELRVSSQQNYGIRLLGPVLSDNSWQAKAGKGFDAAQFQLDWQADKPPVRKAKRVLAGVRPGSGWKWSLPERSVLLVRCARDCTKSATTGRVLHVRPQAAHEALQARRHEQDTPAFRQAYQTRAGIEGTLSQAVRGMGIRRARYDGLHKTQVQHVATAVAINLVRIDAVLTQTPRGKTHQSTFMRLALHPAWQPQKIA